MLSTAGINRHGTGTVDLVISAPTHRDEDVAYTDLMEILPSAYCVMSHFEIELSSEHLNSRGMVIYLKVGVFLGIIKFMDPKYSPDRVIERVPKMSFARFLMTYFPYGIDGFFT